jgi:integrase
MAAYRRLPSGLWQATIRLPDGRRRTRTDPLKGVVKSWAEDAESSIRRGEWADPQDGRITLEQWWERWTPTRVSEYATEQKRASHWRTHVRPRWGNVRLGAITAWDVEAWIAQMKRADVGATTLYQSAQLLRTLMAEAARHRLIATDPTATVRIPVPPKHVDRFLTRDEFEALAVQMPTERDRVMVMLMAMAGLRWGEVAGLHAHRVDLGRGELTVVEVLRRDASVKKQPKSAAGQRHVPIVPALAEALRPFLGEGLVFPGLDYTNWRRRVFLPARDAAALADPQPTIHDLRHSFGSWLAEGGVPPHEIQALMGHSSLRATERYLHAGDGRFGRALTALATPRVAS